MRHRAICLLNSRKFILFPIHQIYKIDNFFLSELNSEWILDSLFLLGLLEKIKNILKHCALAYRELDDFCKLNLNEERGNNVRRV